MAANIARLTCAGDQRLPPRGAGTPLSVRFDTKAIFLARRSSLAISSTARGIKGGGELRAVLLASALHLDVLGDDAPAGAADMTAARCAFRPRPERPYPSAETRRDGGLRRQTTRPGTR